MLGWTLGEDGEEPQFWVMMAGVPRMPFLDLQVL